MISGNICNHNEQSSRLIGHSRGSNSGSYPFILEKSNIIATVISSFLNGKVCPNNTTFKSTIRLCDYFRVYSSCWRSQHMHRAPSLHILENITKRSSHIRGKEKMVGYRLSYLITCMCFVNMRWLANVSFVFPLHTLIAITFVTCTMTKIHCLRALLFNCLLIFSFIWKESDLCISDHCSEKEINIRAPHIFI
jgi:hypothetical protein